MQTKLVQEDEAPPSATPQSRLKAMWVTLSDSCFNHTAVDNLNPWFTQEEQDAADETGEEEGEVWGELWEDDGGSEPGR